MSEGFSNAIIGGAEFLIRSAIKSANYVAGIAGWRIAKDGTAEFGNAVIRGSVSANNGSVTVDSNGLSVTGAGERFHVTSNGDLFITEVPDNGSYLELTSALGFGGLIFLKPENSTVPAVVFFPASLFVDTLESLATNTQPKLSINSPYVTGSPNKAQSAVVLWGQTNTSPTDNSKVEINAGSLILNNTKFSRPNVTTSFTQNIPTGAVTQLNTLVAIKDTYSILNTSAFVLTKAGIWEIGITGRWASNATGQRQIRMQINGVDYYYSAQGFAVGGTLQENGFTIRDTFAALDQINFQAFQNSGVSLVIGNGARAWATLIEEN